MAWPIDTNLFEKNRTSKVLDKEKDGERATILAPITGYVTLLVLATLLRHGGVILIKSFELNVM